MIAVDLFAGAGGFSVAARSRGIDATGLDVDHAAVATARAAGHARRGPGALGDVYGADPDEWRGVEGLLAAPPCDGFSPAGLRTGRGDMGAVRRLITDLAHGRDTRSSVLFDVVDVRSLLVVEPLRWALRLRPRWVLLEQVPAVLPLWQALAAVLEQTGYRTWTGVVHAERYGVPQARPRAVMLAHTDRPVREPRPTHSRYYPTDPGRVDAGTRPWVSMADAIGWPPDALVGLPRLDDGRPGGSVTINGTAYRARDLRTASRPAPTVTEKARSWQVWRPGGQTAVVELAEAAVLQTFPGDYPWAGSRNERYLQVGRAVPPALGMALIDELIR